MQRFAADAHVATGSGKRCGLEKLPYYFAGVISQSGAVTMRFAYFNRYRRGDIHVAAAAQILGRSPGTGAFSR
jgi:hypothetical protein